MSDNRYYYKKNYTGNMSTFGTAIVFTIVGILALVFNAYNINFIGLRSWGYWLFIPAFFIYIGGFSALYWDKRMRDTVFGATLNRKGKVTLENLAQETGIKPNNMLRILVDLRTRKGIQYSYDGESGAINFGEEVTYDKSAEFQSPLPKKQAEVIFPTGEASFCPYCGHKPPAGSKFCESCGSKLE
ncbi:hypothetical protein EU534_01105 [Candidatus Heimdallarchaeota archaeon]|nr:MAG: hypothetical protein EU534_01105 [Candidatus Heimdallarchaeota archaeon]